MKIFACRKCNNYANVTGGMVSACCQAEVFVPNHHRAEVKKQVNIAV